MNEVQRQAIERADAKIKPAMELYEHRCLVAHKVGMLSTRDLKRLVRLLAELTPDELMDVAAYAEALAAWRLPAQESEDAQIAQGSPPPGTGAPGTG